MANFLKIIAFINVFLLIFMSIYEIKNFKRFLKWAFLMILFPIVGFIIYVLFGNNLKFYSKKVLQDKQKSTKNYISQTTWYKNYKSENKNSFNNIASFVKNNFCCDLWHNNSIKTFFNGNDFLKDLLFEIRNAKSSINIEFYIFADDSTGQIVANELIKKARQGVKIKVVCDAFGSKKTKKTFWRNLTDAGIDVVEFFPNFLKLPLINFKINYRNHRKIVVIDGKISYTGGVNLRDDHMSKDKYLSPWRDTVIKIVGPATYPLQDIFFNDYTFVSKENLNRDEINIMFPQIEYSGDIDLQILESGHDKQPLIYKSFLQIIEKCNKTIYIETPYFVTNKEMQTVLKNALKKGVSLTIIIPKRADNKLVYGATLNCLKKLFNMGAKIYLYSNFIHSKVLLCDNVLSIGTCNFDNRSFFLNFEDTCFCYDKSVIKKHLLQIEKDIKNSELLSKHKFNNLCNKYFLFTPFYKIFARFL